MQSQTQPIDNAASRQRKRSSYDSGPVWERLAYGGGTLLLVAGPVWAGMDMMTWMAEFMGINIAIVIACCLLGMWKSLKSPTRTSRRIR